MGEDGGQVGEGGKNDKGADEGGEGRLGAHIDTAEHAAQDSAEDDSSGGIAVGGAHLAEEGTEGRGMVAGEGPKGAAGG